MPLINPSAPRPRNVDDGRKMRPKRKRDGDGGKTARGPRKAPKAHPKAESLPPVGTEDDLSVAQLQQSATLLPQPGCPSPVGAAVLSLRAASTQHAEERNGLLARSSPILEGQRDQTCAGVHIPAVFASRCLCRRAPILPSPRTKAPWVVGMSGLKFMTTST